MKNIFKGSSLALIAALFLNVLSICVYFTSSWESVITHFLQYGFYEWTSTLRYLAYFLVSQAVTCILLIIIVFANNGNSLLGLWVKRRRLEEESKISELERQK